MALCNVMWLFCLALYSQPSLVTVPPEHIKIVHGGSVLPECALFLRPCTRTQRSLCWLGPYFPLVPTSSSDTCNPQLILTLLISVRGGG